MKLINKTFAGLNFSNHVLWCIDCQKELNYKISSNPSFDFTDECCDILYFKRINYYALGFRYNQTVPVYIINNIDQQYYELNYNNNIIHKQSKSFESLKEILNIIELNIFK